MLTVEEKAKISLIKMMTLAGQVDLVTPEQKQWVLDVVRREQIPVPLDATLLAQKQGFDVSGVAIIEAS